MDNRRRISRKAAAAVAIASGALGCGWLAPHKFLLGKPREGILQVLVTVCTLGVAWKIMCLVSILEGLWYLTMSEEGFIAKFGHQNVRFVQSAAAH